MSAKGGKDLLLKLEDSAGAGTYTTIGGLRSKNFSWSADGIDVTNHGSNQNKELLDGAGIKSMSISGEGVFTDDANLATLEAAFIAQALTRFQIIDTSSGGKSYTGLFKITSLERAGEYNGEQTWSISLESSGSITVA